MAQGSTVQSAPPFIGRRHEVDWLARNLQDAIGGEPRVALLTGEAGMGKTRLLTELRRTAARGRVQVCTGRCHESSSTPYLPFLQTLAAQVEQAGGNLDACAGADAAGAVVATRAPCSFLPRNRRPARTRHYGASTNGSLAGANRRKQLSQLSHGSCRSRSMP